MVKHPVIATLITHCYTTTVCRLFTYHYQPLRLRLKRMDSIGANHCEPLFIIATPHSYIRLTVISPSINLDYLVQKYLGFSNLPPRAFGNLPGHCHSKQPGSQHAAQGAASHGADGMAPGPCSLGCWPPRDLCHPHVSLYTYLHTIAIAIHMESVYAHRYTQSYACLKQKQQHEEHSQQSWSSKEKHSRCS